MTKRQCPAILPDSDFFWADPFSPAINYYTQRDTDLWQDDTEVVEDTK